MIKVRKVLYGKNGYTKGEYLGEFAGSIIDVYNRFSEVWMSHSSFDSQLDEKISQADVEYAEEFTLCGEDFFSVGVSNGILYEGITSEYNAYPGVVRDQHGFEQMFDAEGVQIKYAKFVHTDK